MAPSMLGTDSKSQKRIAAACLAVAVCVVAVGCLASPVSARRIYVGPPQATQTYGRGGTFHVREPDFYQNWANDNGPFYVGDVLTFQVRLHFVQ